MKPKNIVISAVLLGTLGASATLIVACGKGVVGGTSAELSFNNPAATAFEFNLLRKFRLIPEAYADLTTSWVNAPFYYGVKFLSAYLAADVDPATQNNVGAVTKIYVNPACPDDPGCSGTAAVTTYFDFARDPTAVNAEINGQRKIVKPGSYKYVRMDFCIGGGTDNVAFKEFAGDPVTTAGSNNCGVTSVVMNPPLSLEKGDQVLINLDYSLDNTLVACGSGDVTGCNGNGKTLAFPAFAPTAKKR